MHVQNRFARQHGLVQIWYIADERAMGLEASVSSGEGLTRVADPSGSDTIDAGSSAAVSTELRADAAGDYTITVEVTGDPERDAVGTDQVEVVDKGGFVERAQRQIEQLRTRVRERDPPSGGQQRQLVAKLDAALDCLEKAERHVDEGASKTANNMLNAASKQLGGFINAVEADGKGRGNAIPDGRRVAFGEAAADIIDLLAEAEMAEI